MQFLTRSQLAPAAILLLMAASAVHSFGLFENKKFGKFGLFDKKFGLFENKKFNGYRIYPVVGGGPYPQEDDYQPKVVLVYRKHHYPAPSYHAPAPVYEAPAPAVYEAPAPAPVYETPAPSYGPPAPPMYSRSSASAAESAKAHSGGSSAHAAPHAHVHDDLSSAGHATATNKYAPGRLVTHSHDVSYYAPIYATSYVPVDYHQPAPAAPSSSYNAPAVPSSSYNAPAAPSSSYNAPAAPSSDYNTPAAPSTDYAAPSSAYAAPEQPQYQVHKQKVGDAAVHSYQTQTLLEGGGYETESKVKDSYGNYQTVTETHYQESPAKYAYGYDIRGGYLDQNRHETRDGDYTSGSYSVKQPDGKTRIVNYTADNGGFKADVKYA